MTFPSIKLKSHFFWLIWLMSQYLFLYCQSCLWSYHIIFVVCRFTFIFPSILVKKTLGLLPVTKGLLERLAILLIFFALDRFHFYFPIFIEEFKMIDFANECFFAFFVVLRHFFNDILVDGFDLVLLFSLDLVFIVFYLIDATNIDHSFTHLF